MALSEKAKVVFKYVKDNDGKDFTAADIAAAIIDDIPTANGDVAAATKVVNGTITGAFQRKGLMIRVPATIKLDDGSTKEIKLIKLTDDGRAFDPDADE